MQIRVKDLENITLMLLKKIKENNGEEIELSNDYYWDINDEELYNPYQSPGNITLGQLSFDYDLLQSGIKSELLVDRHLKWVSNILKAISLNNQPKEINSII